MPSQGSRERARRLVAVVARNASIALILALLVTACGGGAVPERSFTLETLNDSGVRGTVTLAEDGDRTRVTITVEPNGNLDMPAHIHPGTCADLIPQPKFPLENVRDGTSTTVVPATLDELVAGNLAVNVHKANDDLATYTACVDLE